MEHDFSAPLPICEGCGERIETWDIPEAIYEDEKRWHRKCYISKYASRDGKVDLDNIAIYLRDYPEWLHKESYVLWTMAWKEAGASLFYMRYLEPQIDWYEQAKRIHTMCEELAEMRISVIEDSQKNRLRVMKWLYRFKDEVDNQV
jgi:hypothetical protein